MSFDFFPGEGDFQRPAKGTPLDVPSAMALAIREAYQGAAFVSPNPLVGCTVLDKNGKYLKSGHHQKYGGPHAEVHAVEGLTTEELLGAHVIVTLEPCAHEGKTPSCAKMLAKLPIANVTYGLVDPNPLVAGQGADILKEAGISAQVYSPAKKSEDEIQNELKEVCEVFLKNFTSKKLFVALKVATSLDGFTGLANGESQWITRDEARQYTHYLRACYDGIVVSAKTLLADNARLNIRHPLVEKKNKVVVLDPRGLILGKKIQDLNLKLLEAHALENIFWVLPESCREGFEEMGISPANVLFAKTKEDSFLDLEDVHEKLYQMGFRSLMVEAGAQLASQYVSQKQVDRLLQFLGTVIIGNHGLTWTKGLHFESLSQKIVLNQSKFKRFGPDILISGLLG